MTALLSNSAVEILRRGWFPDSLCTVERTSACLHSVRTSRLSIGFKVFLSTDTISTASKRRSFLLCYQYLPVGVIPERIGLRGYWAMEASEPVEKGKGA